MSIRQIQPGAGQLDLLGGAHAVTAELHRLFFALLPDPDTRAALGQAADALRAGQPQLRARWVQPDRYHATLHFMGDHAALRPDIVAAASAAADRVHASAFEWTLDSAASFRGREPPCVLLASEVPAPLRQLWQALGQALALAGQGRHGQHAFAPHVTLGYARAALGQSLAVAPVAWPVREFALIHHVVGHGPYRVLGRWPLGEA